MAFDQLRNFPECGNALSSGATLWLVILTIKIIVSPPGQLPGHYLMSPRGRKKPTTPLSQKRSPYLWKKQNTCILKSSVAQRREKKQSKKYIYSTVLALATSARFFSPKVGGGFSWVLYTTSPPAPLIGERGWLVGVVHPFLVKFDSPRLQIRLTGCRSPLALTHKKL